MGSDRRIKRCAFVRSTYHCKQK